MKLLLALLLLSASAFADTPPALNIFKLKAGNATGTLITTNGVISASSSPFGVTAPLLFSSNTLSIPASSSTVDGYLSASNFVLFSSKQNALTFGNFTASSPFSITGGTGAIIGSGLSLSVASGYYFPTTNDYSLWNSKLGFLTGDVSTAGNVATLASVGTAGTYTKVTTDAKGRVISGTTLSASDLGSGTASSSTYLRGDQTWQPVVGGVTSVFGRSGTVTAQSGDYTTTQVTEGTNLYFTNARAQAAVLSAPVTVTGSASIPVGQFFTVANCSSSCVITLPTASSALGARYSIKTIGSGIPTVTAAGSDLIDGASTAPLTFQYTNLDLSAVSAGWDIL